MWWLATVVVISSSAIFLSERDCSRSRSKPVPHGQRTGIGRATRCREGPSTTSSEGVTDRGDIVQENRDLRQQIEMLEQALAAAARCGTACQGARRSAGIEAGRPEDQLLAANVIAEDASGLKRMIAIDRGSNDGLDEGMVVLSRGGSLGRHCFSRLRRFRLDTAHHGPGQRCQRAGNASSIPSGIDRPRRT